MPILENNISLYGASGKLANQLVYRKTRFGMVVAGKPKKVAQINPVILANRSKFADAVHYAKRQLAKPEVLALYRTGRTKAKGSAYVVAVSDYLSAPTISQIDGEAYRGVAGQPIYVHASDDFRVTSVSIVIKSADGQELERGEAVPNMDTRDGWIYATTVDNPLLKGTSITVAARDVANNVTTEVLTL